MPGKNPDALSGENLFDKIRHILILPAHDPGRPAHLGHLGAQTGKGLTELAPDGAATHHHQTPGQLPQGPDRVRGQIRHLVQTGDGGNSGSGPRGHNNAAGGYGFTVYFNFIWGDNLSLS